MPNLKEATKTRAKTKTPKVPKADVSVAELMPTAINQPVSDSVNGVSSAPVFKASDYLTTNLFESNERVTVLDENLYQQRLERVKGQQRSVHIVQENLILNRQLLKAEGLSIDGQIEGMNNQIKSQDLATAGVKLSQSKTKTSIEQAKLTELGHDLTGHTNQASLKQQTWNLKLDNLRLDIQTGQEMLKAKREAIHQQFPQLRAASA